VTYRQRRLSERNLQLDEEASRRGNEKEGASRCDAVRAAMAEGAAITEFDGVAPGGPTFLAVTHSRLFFLCRALFEVAGGKVGSKSRKPHEHAFQCNIT
ncbi:hypothetical protein MTO96_042311, partial [Rhipicephalus appendiculatus]